MSAFSITVRPEYVVICEGDHCAAAILDLFQRWTYGKHKKGSNTWIYKSRAELKADMMDMFGLNKVANALILLRRLGFLNHRNHPTLPQVRTLQYQVNQQALDEALRAFNPVTEASIEGVESLKINAQELETALSFTDSITESSTDASLKQTTSTPARARIAESAVGVVQSMIPVGEDFDISKTLTPQAESRDAQDEHEAYAFEGTPGDASATHTPPPVPPPPSQDDVPTDVGTEDDGRPDTLPEWADGILIGSDGELMRWLRDDQARLKAWCEAAPALGVGGGFVRNAMRVAKYWPPKRAAVSPIQETAYADFVMS